MSSSEDFLRELDRRTATGQPGVVLVLGLHDFADVNIAVGQAGRETVMAVLAARLTSLAGAGWHVRRVDGQIFAALPPTTGPEPSTPVDLVARLTGVLTEPVEVGPGIRVPVTASVGVAVSPAAQPVSGRDLLRDAEAAMYGAKSGRQPWAVYEALPHEQAGDRLRLVTELRTAIDAGQLEVHYQPIVDLRTGRASSVEALVRWRHPERGMVAPGEFIGLAEQHGLIDAVTTFVVETVAAQTRVWAAAGRSLPCAVNLSLSCLIDPVKSEKLVASLSALADVVTVEVTESTLADDRAVEVLHRLAGAGVLCAIDDFGTGYSCLGSLKELPVRTVKIDQSFVRDIETDDRDLAIVEATLELTGALGLDVIAEGIETPAVAACLLGVGVVRGQGYLFARPMTATALDGWLDTRSPATPGGAPSAAALRHHLAHTAQGGGRRALLADSTEQELLRQLTSHVSRSLVGPGHAIVIADRAHGMALRGALPPRRLGRADREGHLVILDVRATLALFMRAGTPDPVEFESSVGRLVRSHQRASGVLTVYEEMVGALRADGNATGALQLEGLWETLRERTACSLLSAGPAADGHDRPEAGPVPIEHRNSRAGPGGSPTGTSSLESMRVLLNSARALLRVDSAEQAVGVLIRAVSDLGGSTVPAFQEPADAIPIDISLGVSDPLLPVAPPRSPARHDLERLLPGLVEDARAAAGRSIRLARLAEQIDTDPLTGLGNARGLAKVRELGDADSIAVVELDHFAHISDTQGTPDGDRILVAFSRTLRQHLRSGDLLFRLGDAEFLLVLAATEPEGVVTMLDRLRERWEFERPRPVTFSAGVAAVTGGNLRVATLLARPSAARSTVVAP